MNLIISLIMKYGEFPNTEADDQSLDFNSRYGSANINMESSTIIVNISLKLICEEKCSRFGIPNSRIM